MLKGRRSLWKAPLFCQNDAFTKVNLPALWDCLMKQASKGFILKKRFQDIFRGCPSFTECRGILEEYPLCVRLHMHWSALLTRLCREPSVSIRKKYPLEPRVMLWWNSKEIKLCWVCTPGGILPYMGYIGMCRCEGYGFQAVYSRIGYLNQSVWL